MLDLVAVGFGQFKRCRCAKGQPLDGALLTSLTSDCVRNLDKPANSITLCRNIQPSVAPKSAVRICMIDKFWIDISFHCLSRYDPLCYREII